MADLTEQIKTFLEAEGYTVGIRRELLVGSRRTLAEEIENVYVWVPLNYDPARFASREAGFVSRFNDVSSSDPTGSKFLVVPTLEGLSRQFRDGVMQWYRVNIRTPLQFFDTEFKWDASREAPSAARDLRDKGREERLKRVEQPYTIEGTRKSGGDLLEALRIAARSRRKQDKSIQIVIGPAGIGKSYLFRVLFAELHEAFMSHKTRGGPYAPRPLPLLPEYIPVADARTVRSLLAAYLRTDFARPLSRETFEWLLANGYAIWMLDGLDEVISQDPSFFDYLLDLLTLPNATAKPKILICVRDALLTVHEAFGEFLEEYADHVEVFRLAKWETPSKRRFAELTLGDRSHDFLRILQEKPELDELASTPYYCHLLSEQFASGQLRETYSESSLLEHALSSIILRDYDKGFIDRDLLSPNDVAAFLEAAASQDFEQGFQGVSVQDAQEWARVLLPADLSQDEEHRLSSQMVSLALFSQGSPGHLRFSQDILEHYLLGRRLISLFSGQDSGKALLRELAQRELPGDWLTIRLLAEHVKNTNQFGRLRNLACEAIAYPAAFKNALKIALLCPDGSGALKEIPFERCDLSGLVFNDLDLTGVSFRGCNLTDTEFRQCNLSGAVLADAILKNTGFLSLPTDGLRGADVGDLTKFFSIRVDRGRVIGDHTRARKWFHDRTQKSSPMVEPCSACLQLRFLFNKLVYPDGTARRSWLKRKAMVSGRRFHDSPEDVLEAAIRHGYLREEERYRERIHRPDGQLYSELLEFATSLRLTPGIRAVLDDVCDINGCPHAPKVQ